MDGVDAQIILLCLQFYFQRIFQKENTVENLTCLVKWVEFFHLEEREFYLLF